MVSCKSEAVEKQFGIGYNVFRSCKVVPNSMLHNKVFMNQQTDMTTGQRSPPFSRLPIFFENIFVGRVVSMK